jgi:putative hemin transport protein
MAIQPADLRALRIENPTARARDFAHAQGITEADLVAAHVGHGTTAIDATLDRLMPLIEGLGDVMALTRNDSAVHERRGVYAPYHGGAHAQMILGPEIDMRMFPKHWVFGFAVDETVPDGRKCSLQIFDAAGDAVHKIHLKPESDFAAFDALVATLRLPDQVQTLTLAPRAAVEAPKGDAARADALRADWDAMTDTHQFFAMTNRHKMNRLGAYHVIGAPHVQRLDLSAVTQTLTTCATEAIPVMIFVGNAGCIQIHGGLIEKVVPMGPWINVMDPRFNLHLREDHIAEAYCVSKPTKRGTVYSVEAFDKDGALILQIFGYRKDAAPDAWDAMTARLPRLVEEMA